MCWGHIWSNMDSWRIIDVGINMGRKDLMKQRWEIHIWKGRSTDKHGEEDHNNGNESDILGFTDDDIEFQVHNIKEMVRNVERHSDDISTIMVNLCSTRRWPKTLISHSIMVLWLSIRDCLQMWNFSNWKWATDGVIVVLRTCWCLRACYPKATQPLRPFMRQNW
jgi:hypothetical protein